MSFKPQALFLAAALLLMAVLSWFNGQPVAADLVRAPWDLLAHFAVFFVLAVLLLWGLGPQRLWLVVLLAIAYAAFDELHQLTLPGRHASFMDFAADVLAVGAGMAIGFRFLRFPGSCLNRN
ncbi:MAG: VanZ family protein [Hydrogenophilales bacterium]|nr:VanZ family protein [Hydrogenophilales bacterium]